MSRSEEAALLPLQGALGCQRTTTARAALPAWLSPLLSQVHSQGDTCLTPGAPTPTKALFAKLAAESHFDARELMRGGKGWTSRATSSSPATSSASR